MRKQRKTKAIPLLAICLLSVIPLLGCNTTAIIRTQTGMVYDGRIIGNDDENVYISAYNSIRPIEKSEIVTIRHPGLVRGIIWSGVAAYGVANIAVGVPMIADQPQSTRGAFTIGVFLPAALGTSLLIKGFMTMSRSKTALNRPYSPSESD